MLPGIIVLDGHTMCPVLAGLNEADPIEVLDENRESVAGRGHVVERGSEGADLHEQALQDVRDDITAAY